MKEVLSVFIRRLAGGLAAASLMVGSLLLARGEADLIGALLLGYLAALVFVWNMAWRLWRIAAVPTGGAKKQMLWGLVLRLLVLFIVLFAAVQISTQVFSIVALGFVLCYAWAMVLMIRMNSAK